MKGIILGWRFGHETVPSDHGDLEAAASRV